MVISCYHDATTVERMTDVPAARTVFDTNFFARKPLVDLWLATENKRLMFPPPKEIKKVCISWNWQLYTQQQLDTKQLATDVGNTNVHVTKYCRSWWNKFFFKTLFHVLPKNVGWWSVLKIDFKRACLSFLISNFWFYIVMKLLYHTFKRYN